VSAGLTAAQLDGLAAARAATDNRAHAVLAAGVQQWLIHLVISRQ
jgi:hypothetical protein